MCIKLCCSCKGTYFSLPLRNESKTMLGGVYIVVKTNIQIDRLHCFVPQVVPGYGTVPRQSMEALKILPRFRPQTDSWARG